MPYLAEKVAPSQRAAFHRGHGHKEDAPVSSQVFDPLPVIVWSFILQLGVDGLTVGGRANWLYNLCESGLNLRHFSKVVDLSLLLLRRG